MSEEKEIEGKSTTTGKQSSAGIVGRFLSVFDVMGEHSMKQIVLSLPFILFLLLLAFLHIANNNLAEQYVRKINRAEKELKMYRWQYMTVSSKLMKVTKQSEIAKRVEENGLKELRQAPLIIEVQDNKASTK